MWNFIYWLIVEYQEAHHSWLWIERILFFIREKIQDW